MTKDQPDWDDIGRQFSDAGRNLAEGLKKAGQTLAFQGAAGWMFQGNLEQARAALAGMTPEGLRAGSLAAAALAALCDELLSQEGNEDR